MSKFLYVKQRKDEKMIINKQTLKDFRISFKESVKSLEEEYGVKVNMKNISFGDISFTTKIEVINGGDPKEVARNSFQDDLNRYGYRFPEITMEHFDNGLRYYGNQIKIVGLKPRSPKYPIVYKKNGTLFSSSKRFKTTYKSIVVALGILS